MALQAKSHGERLRLVGKRHGVNLAMTTLAAHPFGDMNTVVEIYVSREVGDSVPDDRRIVGKARADRGKKRGIGPDLRMAGHTRHGGRQPRACGGFDRGVAKAAVKPQAGDMVLMAERNGLRDHSAHVTHVIGSRPEPPGEESPDNDCRHGKQSTFAARLAAGPKIAAMVTSEQVRVEAPRRQRKGCRRNSVSIQHRTTRTF